MANGRYAAQTTRPIGDFKRQWASVHLTTRLRASTTRCMQFHITTQFAPPFEESSKHSHVEYHNSAFRVRVMLAGKNKRVAWSMDEDRIRRFADMVLYRLGRTERLNYSVVQVEADLAAHTDLKAILNAICVAQEMCDSDERYRRIKQEDRLVGIEARLAKLEASTAPRLS